MFGANLVLMESEDIWSEGSIGELSMNGRFIFIIINLCKLTVFCVKPCSSLRWIQYSVLIPIKNY